MDFFCTRFVDPLLGEIGVLLEWRIYPTQSPESSEELQHILEAIDSYEVHGSDIQITEDGQKLLGHHPPWTIPVVVSLIDS